jgi:ABC-type multidrug transport system ATPase subunit
MDRANDRILVLDHGEVVEFGTPWELIQKDGMFRELCRQSGEDTQLMEVSLPLKYHTWAELMIDGETC